MAQNLISATLSAADAEEVIQSLTMVKGKLKFLLSLQNDDVILIFKLGNAYFPFIEKAYQVVVAHPEILPAVFDKDEFLRDYALLNALRPIFNQMNELTESVRKTFMAVGSDSLVASLEVYSQVKQNKDKVPGLKVMADEMAVFFKRPSRSKTKTKTE